MSVQQRVPTPDEIWKILKEVSVIQKQLVEERKQRQEELAKERKERQKELAKERKARQEELAKERKAREEERKEREEERKQRQEELAKERKAREEERKEREEERKARQEELAKERKAREEEQKKQELAEAKAKAELAELAQRAEREKQAAFKAIRESDGRLDNRWGDLVEGLVVGKLLSQLQERGIQVHRSSQNESGSMISIDSSGREKREECEVDLIAKNSKELVAVEVKSTLSPKKVDRFLYVLAHFHKMFPEYSKMRVYGAVAYLRSYKSAARYAEKKGLFVIKAVGDSSNVINETSFQPKIFCAPRKA